MGLLDKLFGKTKNQIDQTEIEHAVIIHFNYEMDEMDALYELRDKLEQIIEANQLGEYDGHEISTTFSDGFLYMYGPNAELLFNAIKETLEETRFMQGAEVTLRFGPPEKGVEQQSITIGA